MNLQRKSISLSVGFFFLGFLALVLGDYFFAGNTKSILADLKVYIIPITFVLLVAILTGNTKVYFRGKGFLKGFFLGLLAMCIPLIFSLFSQVLPYIDKPLPKNWEMILLGLIALNFCIGFFEESLFRNVILNTLLKDESRQSYRRAFYGSAILFGLIHIGNLTLAMHRPIAIMTQIIYATMLGILFAAIYLYTKNIWAVIILHGLTDFINNYPRLYETNATFTSNVHDMTLANAGLTLLLILPSMIIGLIIFKKMMKKRELSCS